MTASELMAALAEAGASMEVILIAVRALDARDAALRDQAKAQRERIAHETGRKRAWRAARAARATPSRDMSRPCPGTVPGQSRDIPPNERYSNPPLPPSSKDDLPPPTEDRLLEIAERVTAAWNRAAAGTPLPPVRALNADRLRHLRARLAEHDEAAVLRAIANMAGSDWHSGRSGKWREGNLGWLLRNAENFQKMLERGEGAPPAGPATDWTPERRAAHLRAVAAQRGEGDPRPEPRVVPIGDAAAGLLSAAAGGR